MDSVIQYLFYIAVGLWYADWYMIIVYALVLWALLIPIFIGWFYYSKRRESVGLPPADPWIGN